MCYQHFAGYKCDIDLRPCSYKPCMNAGECLDTDLTNTESKSGFKCNCTKHYVGSRCETKIDVCQNELCSSNGYCVDVEHLPMCKCYKFYSGEKCEIKSAEMAVIKITRTLSLIVAICSFFLVILIVIFLDLNLCKNKKTTKKKEKPIPENVDRYEYVNFKK